MIRQDNHIEIMKLLNWDQEAFAWFQYETGLKYLAYFLPGDAEGQRLLEQQPLFWNWWKNHWNIRDAAFIQEGTDLPLFARISLYKTLHNPYELSSELKPSKLVVRTAFATIK